MTGTNIHLGHVVDLLVEATAEDVSKEKVHLVYETCAAHYDKGVERLMYTCPTRAASYVAEYLGNRKKSRILDAAAGTGLLGIELRKLGYLSIDALDSNQAMLDIAKDKGCYENMICDYLGKNRLDIADDSYDAIVTTGSFIPGHVTDDCFEEVIRIISPGGVFILVMKKRYLINASVFKEKLEPRIQLLQESGAWKLLLREEFPNYQRNEDGLVFVLKIEPKK